MAFDLRPGITNPVHWFPNRLLRQKWEKLREKILKRDKYTCCFCGHRALKWMNIHHIATGSNRPSNLKTICVACHAVLHIGFNLEHGIVEIWKSEIPQIEIVRRTREGIEKGKSLAQIKKTLKLKKGRHSPKSVKYANDLIQNMGKSPRAYLEKPLCAVFVNLKRWQIENENG